MMQPHNHPKNICVYHDNCLDGFAAAYVFHKNKPGTYFIAGAYNSESHEHELIALLQKTTAYYEGACDVNLYLVDFSYKPNFIERLLTEFRTLHIYVIDHHKSAITDLQQHKNTLWKHNSIARLHLHLDDKHSGAYLTSKFFSDTQTPRAIIRFVSDYDTWVKESQYTDAICAGLFHLAYMDETIDLYDAFAKWDSYYDSSDANNPIAFHDIEFSDKLRELYLTGFVLNESRRRRAKHLAKADKIQMIDIAGHTVPLIHAPHEVASFAAEELVLDHPFVAVYYLADGKGCYSLRSSKKNPNWVDVEVIAKLYGGGGHANAAGFKAAMVKHKLPKLKMSLWDHIVERHLYAEMFILLCATFGFYAGFFAGKLGV